MSQYDNTNRGVLFENDRKETENHPDMNGTININGVDHWFSGWWKQTRSGSEFLSLSIGKPKEAQAQQGQKTSRNNQPPSQRQQQRAIAKKHAGGFDDMDDSAPF